MNYKGVPYHIEQIVNQMKLNNTFSLESGSIIIDGNFPIINGGFVSWDSGSGKLKESSGTWSIVTVEGSNYNDGETITPDYPYFQHGHPLELNEILVDLGKTKDKKKYPLIYLKQDIDEVIENDEVTIDSTPLYFLTLNSKKTSRAKDRYAKTFTPILLPLFFEFLETLDYVGAVSSVNRKTDRLYWGRQEEYKNAANILDDPIDGVDSDLNITLNMNDCLIK